LICGDDFIKEKSEDFLDLKTALSTKTSYIFEHISAPAIFEGCGIKPDIAIGICRESDDKHHAKQTRIVQNFGCHVITAKQVRDALKSSLERLDAAGLFPNPLTNFVIKVASRCNLNCSYCYMYHALDDSSTTAPVYMAQNVAKMLGQRMAAHSDQNNGIKLSAIIHGGEPLSLRPDIFKQIISEMKNETSTRNVSFGVQTNGTRITNEYLHILDELGMQIGISLDGNNAFANRYRVYHSGAQAYSDILRGVETCLRFPFKNGGFSGVLCVIDPSSSGRETYKYLRSLGLSGFDFLLRDEHHSFGPGGQTTSISAGEFLCDAFDEWLADPSPCDVRIFRTLIALTLSANYSTDSLGLHPMNAVGVSTNGEWELLDVLRICFPSAWKTPYTVFDTSISEAGSSPEFRRLLNWQYDLSDTCLTCKQLFTCGGGYLPHRYNQENMFRNPSSHCDALFKLINHIEACLMKEGINKN